MINTNNLNTTVGKSLETARRWLAEGDDPANVYEALAPAILEVNAKLLMPSVSPTRSLENLLRIRCGWDPSQQRGSSTAADCGPC